MKKKALSLALALVMCLSLTIPAFAGETLQSVYLNGYDTSDGLTGVKEGNLLETQMELTVRGTLKQVDTGVIRDFLDMGDFTYPVFEAPASGVIVTVWENDWLNKCQSWIERATISKVSYDMANKNYTILQENAVLWNESPLEAEDQEAEWELYVREGTWVNLNQPGTYLIDIRYAVIAGGCIAVVIIPDSGNTTPVEPEKPAEVKTANPSNDKLTVNGAEATPTVYNIDNSNYFKIRDVAALLNGTEKQFSVGYDGEKQSVTATTGQGYDKLPTDLAGAPAGAGEAKASGDAIYVNGAKITPEVYNINGNNYFKLRDLGQALDFYIGWSLERGVYIETDKPYAG